LGRSGDGACLRVLVVDDDRDTADITARLLHHWGHHSRAAYDGTTALQEASAFRPDVMLLDIGMPENGNVLARKLRAQTQFAHTKLVAVTGYADPAHRQQSLEAGFDFYLVKPVAPDMLRSLLASFTRLISAPREQAARICNSVKRQEIARRRRLKKSACGER
jgi:CheY-like chemotaxis protein